jgi:hypothetical protein
MREYGIDLVTDLPRITLRRFLVLVRGLGPNSAVANREAARRSGTAPAVWPARARSPRPSSRRSSAGRRAG